MAIKTIYHFELLTGGSGTALDSVDGNSLLDKDRAFTIVGDVLYVHQLDADSGAGEMSPAIIAPDTNPGDKRWLLLGTRYLDADLTFTDMGTGFSLSGGTIPKTLYVYDDLGTAPPVSGTYSVGWKRWHSAPELGGNLGWICVAAGTPGTWAEFGFISANEA